MAALAPEQTTILDLPVDILLLIIPYLTVLDFTRLLRSSKELYRNDEIRYAPSYWKSIVRSTYRIPIQPIVVSDGKRWMNLYRKIRSQSRLYSWGQFNGEDIEGLEAPRVRLARPGRRMFPRPQGRFRSGWPRPIREDSLEGIGKIVDLQAGGWSTVFLSSRGSVYMNGQITGNIPPRHYTQQKATGPPRRLQFPNGYHPVSEDSPPGYYDPHTAISQFSAGRAHVLGLTDAGGIWTWHDAFLQGLQVKLPAHERNGQVLRGRRVGHATKVLAGWSTSSAYLHGIGLTLWDPVDNLRVLNQSSPTEHRTVDRAYVSDAWIVPLTDYVRTPKDNASTIGEVVNWVLLEGYVVFVTDIGKTFFSNIGEQQMERPLEMTLPSNISKTGGVADVQGSFRNFGLLLKNGEVLTGDVDLLKSLKPDGSVSLRKIPSLQHAGVISLAFGDYHFHALHADGTISSHGREPSYEGALGLGENGAEALRGIYRNGTDGQLHVHCETTGRRVQFEEEKRLWLEHLSNLGHQAEEARDRAQLFRDREEVRAQVSEYIEQRLRSAPQDASQNASPADVDYEDLPPYFALSVAAAGWHSGALVLVNEEKATSLRNKQKVTRQPKPAPESQSQPQEPHEAAEAETGILTTVSDTAWNMLRWYIGLPQGSTSENASDHKPNETPSAPQGWVWEDEPFPRLRLKDGGEMPGSVELVDWTCPEWKDIELVEVQAVRA